MVSDKLTRKQDRALHNALASVVLTAFPNPERKDCPGRETLLLIARKKLPMWDPRGKHVTRCSPCFSELRGIQTEIRHKHMLWLASATACLCIAIATIAYVVFQVPLNDRPLPGSTSSPTVIVDLRKSSGPRNTEAPASIVNTEIPKIGRGVLQLVIQLPIGADEGPYELEIRSDDQSPLTATKAEARIENYVTTVRARVDTTRIPPAKYTLAIRQAGFGWRYYPIVLQ
jgi:hypothetical protein